MKRLLAILFVLLFTTQVVAQDYKVWLPVVIKIPEIDRDVDNKWRIIQALASTNEVLNPSAETTGNFSSVSGATVSRETTYQKYGLYSYRIQTAGAGDGIQLTTRTLANTHHYVTVRVRGTDFTQLQASISGNAKNLTLIEKIDSDWNLYGASFGATLVSGATAVQILDTATGGDFYIDGIQVEPQTVWTTYIDGSQEGCGWLGADHASASERSGQSRAGGTSEDFWLEYGFQLRRISGAGASTHNLNVDSYATLPGGELNSDKVESRNFNIIGKFIADSEEELHEYISALEAAFQTDDNQLTRIRFNGAKVQKEIAVRYESGLESDLAAFYGNVEIVEDEEYVIHELWTMPATIQVVAPNPDWLEVGESAAELDTNDSATFRIVAGRLRSTGQWDELGPPDAAGTYTRSHFGIAEDDTYVYFGGNFTNFDNIANADYIVRWHKINQAWSALGSGMNGNVWDIIIGPDGTVYACGEFTTAGGGAANRIASWNGSTWSALGSGVDDVAYNMVIGLDGTLYVIGAFLNAGGAGANRIASWDGSAWSTLGTGLDNTSFALAIGLDGTIYAGGNFASAGGSAADRVASWDGSTWSALGGGVDDGIVYTLATGPDGTLFAGGTFTTVEGSAMSKVAQWNGTSWSTLGSGMDNTVRRLVVGPDGLLYAGGAFTTAGGVDLADGVARWNNYVWAHMDIDLPGSAEVYSVLPGVSDPVVEQNYDLFIGFDTTGTGTFANAVTVTNEGTVQAFPKIIYTRTGGTTAVIETLRNETTGKELLFDYALLDGETLVIDLAPLAKSINSSFFGSRLDAVLANSDFGIWSLQRGDNNITSYINESGTPTLAKYMLWRDAYSGYN